MTMNSARNNMTKTTFYYNEEVFDDSGCIFGWAVRVHWALRNSCVMILLRGRNPLSLKITKHLWDSIDVLKILIEYLMWQ
jgi:hypothetical protein